MRAKVESWALSQRVPWGTFTLDDVLQWDLTPFWVAWLAIRNPKHYLAPVERREKIRKMLPGNGDAWTRAWKCAIEECGLDHVECAAVWQDVVSVLRQE